MEKSKRYELFITVLVLFCPGIVFISIFFFLLLLLMKKILCVLVSCVDNGIKKIFLNRKGSVNSTANKNDYFKTLLSDVEKCNYKAFVQEAYKVALDTRKFEIELYWKRATYFWTIIGAIFLAYFNAVKGQFNNLTIFLASLGLLFSIGWYFVSIGSKFWQENWEMHISFLEKYNNGALFSNVLGNKNQRYSVTKINTVLAGLTLFFWCVILFYDIIRDNNFKEVIRNIFPFFKFIMVIIVIFAIRFLSVYSKLRHEQVAEKVTADAEFIKSFNEVMVSNKCQCPKG